MFLDDLDKLTDTEAVLAFDVYHAFDSPPKYLIHHTLQRMGTPVKLLLLITLVLDQGATFIRSAEDVVFTTTHGVKQGCPLSCFLFVVVFDIPLRYLEQKGVTFSAYVDDIASPVPRRCSQSRASLVQHALSLIACQVNALKSESLQVGNKLPDLPTLPKYYHPPCPVQAEGASILRCVPAEEPPPWSSQAACSFSRTACLMHLGHPLPAKFEIHAAVTVLLNELRSQLNELHAQPIQVLDRVLLVNSMVLPRLLYRTECIPLTEDQTMSFTRTLERFIFGVMGLPLTIAQKTLYSHRSHGLGLGYFPVLHPTRALDVLHRNNHLSTLSTTPRLSMSPYNLFMSSVSKFKTSSSTVVPLDVSWKGAKIAKNATSVVSFAGLTVYLLPSSHKPNDTYSDGSKIGSPPAAGAAALLSTGEIVVCRVPGIPNSYKAELVGILLVSHLSAAGKKIKLDCQGAIASATGTKRPVRQATWVLRVRQSIREKGQTLEWVEGHVGHEYNEVSDDFAKQGTTLPRPPPVKASSVWDIIRHGELVLPPHKTWTHDYTPSHTHDRFHPISWKPLKFRRVAWHKWLFGLQSRLGYSHYATFWADRPSATPCPTCSAYHNLSVHGVVTHCTPAHPLVSAWLQSWPCPALVNNWRALAHRQDLRVAGRLAIPRSLYQYLRSHLGGARETRQTIGRFQSAVLDNVTAALADSVPHTSRRPSVFCPHDWRAPSSLF